MAGKRFTVDAVFRGINKISKPARSMGRSISKFVKKSNRQIQKLGRSFKKLGSFMGKAIIGGAGVAAAAMGAAVLKTAELGDEAAKTSRRLGITAESLQELRFAADRQGVSASVLSSSFTALQKRVGELKAGTGSLFAFLKKTGDTAFIRQLKLAKNTEEAFEMITKKAATIKDPMEKAAFASAAFSRAGVDMLKMMEAGTGGISKLRQEARKYGAVISNEAAAKSELFVDAMTNLKSVVGGVGKTLGAKLIPILTPLIQGFADFWAMNKKGISSGIDKFISVLSRTFKFLAPIVSGLFGSFKKLFSAFLTAASSLLPSFTAETNDMKSGVVGLADAFKFMAGVATKAFEFITFLAPFLKPFIATLLIYKGILIAIALVTKGWAIAQGILNAAMAINPVVLVVVAIAALVAGIVLLVQNWETVVSSFKSGAESIRSFFVGLWDDIFGGFESAITTVMDKIKKIPGVSAAFKFLGFDGNNEKKPEPKPVTPQERLSRTIQENTDRSIQETNSENNSVLTVKDETGRAELSKQKKGGPQIVLATSGDA